MKTLYNVTGTAKTLKSFITDGKGNFYLISWLIVLMAVLYMSCSAPHDKMIDKRFKKHASNKSLKAYYSIQMR